MSANGDLTDRSSRRLDQWLWFARFVKSRSLAARFCAAGSVMVNGISVVKPNHAVRAGDVVSIAQGDRLRTVRVVALGTRRGPAPEARMLFDDEWIAARHRDPAPAWEPLLMSDADDD